MRRDLTFRVFVSSTFNDFVEERNALQTHVFPRLRAYCEERGARFQPVDLRWGVNEEAALDQQTMNICFEELARCQELSPRPNFIVLLGDRYGWRPLPPQIAADEFEALLGHVPADRRALLERWYLRDDNAVPVEYYLKPRVAAPDDRGELAEWLAVQPVVHAALEEAARHVFPDPADPRRRAYEESATHQEIRRGALEADTAAQHVHCYFRTIEGLPADEPAGVYRDLVDGQPDIDAEARLVALKDRLAALSPASDARVFRYSAAWDGARPLADLTALCARVEQDLAAIIDAEARAFAAMPALDRELAAHREFAEHRTRLFVGREDALSAISARIATRSAEPIVVHGVAGCGKTALLAKLVEVLTSADAPEGPHPMVVARFIGTTPASSDVRSLLTDLSREIGRLYGDPKDVPMEMAALLGDFRRRLGLATADRPLVVVLDALDQLASEDGPALQWMPWHLPPHVALVVSVLTSSGPGGDAARVGLVRVSPAQRLGLEPMSRRDLAELIAGRMALARRTLQPAQQQLLLDACAASGLPLCSQVACEQARRWRSSDRVAPLPNDLDGLIGHLLDRLEEERHHGAVITGRALAYLAASRYGLSEEEFLDLLSTDDEVMRAFARRSPDAPRVARLPMVVWSRLRADLAPYVADRRVDRSSVIAFYHREVGAAVTRRYLGNAATGMVATQRRLAEYFQSALWTASAEPDTRRRAHHLDRTDVRRALAELPYHLCAARMRTVLEQTLTRFDFIEKKCLAGMVFELSADYARALDTPWEETLAGSVPEFGRALLAETPHLLADPWSVFPQFAYQLAASTDADTRAALDAGAAAYHTAGRWWLRTVHGGGTLARVVADATDDVACVVVAPGDATAVCASADGWLTAFQWPDGQPLWKMRVDVPVRIENVAFPHGVKGVPSIDVAIRPTALVVAGDPARVLLEGTAPASCVRVEKIGVTAHEFSDSRAEHLVWLDLQSGGRLGQVARPGNHVLANHATQVVTQDQGVWRIDTGVAAPPDAVPEPLRQAVRVARRIALVGDLLVIETGSGIELCGASDGNVRHRLAGSARIRVWTVDAERQHIIAVERDRLLCWSMSDGGLLSELAIRPASDVRAVGDGLVVAGAMLCDPAAGTLAAELPANVLVHHVWRDRRGARMILASITNRVELAPLEDLTRGRGREVVAHFDVAAETGRLVSAADRAVSVHDPSGARMPTRTFTASDPVRAVAVAPCGERVAWAIGTGAVMIADAASGQTLADLATGVKAPIGCRFRGREEIVVWGEYDVEIWNIGRKRRRFSTRGVNAPNPPLYVYPLLVVADIGGFKIYDVRLRCRLRRLRPRDRIIHWAADAATSTLCTVHVPSTPQEADRRHIKEQSRAWVWRITHRALLAGRLRSLGAALLNQFSGFSLGAMVGEPVRKGPDCGKCFPTTRGQLVVQAGRMISIHSANGREADVMTADKAIGHVGATLPGDTVLCADSAGRLGVYRWRERRAAHIALTAPIAATRLDAAGRHVVALDIRGRLHAFEFCSGGPDA